MYSILIRTKNQCIWIHNTRLLLIERDRYHMFHQMDQKHGYRSLRYQ